MWLSDIRLVLPDQILERGSLRIEASRIAEIIEGPAPDPVWNLAGLTAIPGIIDFHGDMLEREIQPRPKAQFPVDLGIYELDKRLAANGVTTAYAAISFNWSTNNKLRTEERAREIITTLNQLRPGLLVDHHIHVRFEITNPQAGAVLSELLDAGLVHLASLNDHTPGQGQYRDIEAYIKTMTEWRKTMVDDSAIEADLRRHVETAQARPKAWDVARRLAQLSHQRNIPIASHDDDTPEKIAFVAELGATISEFPVTMEAAQAAKAHGMSVVMGAPNAFRGYSHSSNLSALDAIKAGVVDILAADYYPATLLQAACQIAEKGILSIPQAINLISQNPAKALDLNDRGSLSVGKLADIVLVERLARPRVRGVWRAGIPVYRDSYLAHLNGHSSSTSYATRSNHREAHSLFPQSGS